MGLGPVWIDAGRRAVVGWSIAIAASSRARKSIPWPFLAQLLLGLLLHLHPATALAAEVPASAPLAVIYPDIGEPYRSVFASIIEGIEDRTRSRVINFAVSSQSSAADLSNELKRREVRTVIALGRGGLRLAEQLDRRFGIVAGGVLSVPDADEKTYPIYSLAPDPGLLFSRLRGLLPGVRRIIVIYSPQQNTWLIRLAREAARAQGLELVAREADDLKTSIRLHQEALAAADPRRDALWLVQDSNTVDEGNVLPLVLRESWDRNLCVFSSSASHVQRGALFSAYPDNLRLGRALAARALAQSASGSALPNGVQPLTQLLYAVNTRTAKHLGIHLEATEQRFDLVFPEP